MKSLLYNYVAVFAPASVVIPLIVAGLKRSVLSWPFKIICWYLFLGAGTSILFNVLAYRGVNNMPLSHLYTVLELTVLVLFYHSILGGKKMSLFLFGGVLPFFVVAAIVNVIFFQSISSFNTYTKSIEAVAVIFLSIVYFAKRLDWEGTVDQRDRSLIIVNSAFLLYFAGSFIWFTIFNFTLSNLLLGQIMWGIHATLLLVQYSLIGLAIWKLD